MLQATTEAVKSALEKFMDPVCNQWSMAMAETPIFTAGRTDQQKVPT
jgi:hypothetical protein